MKKLIYLSTLFLFIGLTSVYSQDKIYKANGEVIEVKVTEIGASEIKYKVFANLNGPIYTIQKQQVLKIVYEAGNTEMYSGELAEKVMVIEKRAQNFYVEILGQGLLFTANYDTRFSHKRNGIGGRIGFGALSIDGTTLITAPISLNYLLGKEKSFFEIGLGVTYVSASTSNSGSVFFENGSNSTSTILGTMSFMYRLQPKDSGFSFRGGFTPYFNKDGFIPYYPGISLGYTF